MSEAAIVVPVAVAFAVLASVIGGAFFIGRRLGSLEAHVSSATADLKTMATKDDISELRKHMEGHISLAVTPLQADLTVIKTQVANLATREDLHHLQQNLLEIIKTLNEQPFRTSAGAG